MAENSKPEIRISKRGQAWVQFSDMVLRHIEDYTVPQYGDEGDDLAQDYTEEEAFRNITKLIRRFGRNARPAEQGRDFVKMAHWAQIAWYIWRRKDEE